MRHLTDSETDSIDSREYSRVGPYGTEQTVRARGRSDTPEGDVVTTGTTTVALAGAEGVVLAADTRASLGGRFVTNRSARKVDAVDERVALTFAGGVADAQSLCDRLRAEVRLYRMRERRTPRVETVARLAASLVRNGPYRLVDLLLGGVDPDGTPAIYDIGIGGGVLETPFAASGSGMQLAYGAIERRYEDGLTVDELESLAGDAVRVATERDTASGDGLTLASVRSDGLTIDGPTPFRSNETADGTPTADDGSADEEVA